MNESKYVVVDGFLSPDELHLVRSYQSLIQHEAVPSERVWSLQEDRPLRSAMVGTSPHHDGPRAPTGMGVDIVMNRIMESKDLRDRFNYSDITCQSYLYPNGSALGWHNDGNYYPKIGQRHGAFILYTHSRWHAEWGGLLLLCDVGLDKFAEDMRVLVGNEIHEQKNVNLDRDWCFKLAEEIGGAFIFPKPNRLVMMTDLMHRVTPIHGASFPRQSFAGFLY